MPLRRPGEITYDYLLLAMGSETNYFGMNLEAAGVATMKTLGDAALLRNRMVALLEEAAQETDESRRRRLMTFVVVGGGFAGVETVGAITGKFATGESASQAAFPRVEGWCCRGG